MDGISRLPIKGQNDADTLLTYLNNQPDMLTAIVKHRTDFKGQTGDIYLLPLPRTLDKVVVAVHPPSAGGETQEVVLPFDPPMADFREFRQRVLGWRDAAFKHYKAPAKPAVPYYSPPPLFPLTIPIILGLGAVIFASYGTGFAADWFRGKIIETFGKGMIPAARWFAIVMHVLEAGYMVYATIQHRVPFVASLKWIGTTLLLGFPAINELWESVQYERLRVIYRQTDVGEIPVRTALKDGSKAGTASAKRD